MLTNIRNKIKRRSRKTGSLYNSLIILLFSASIFTIITLSVLLYKLDKSLVHLETQTKQLSARIEYMDLLQKRVYKEVIAEAMTFAPKGKSIYQLRGDAQTEAQRVLDRLTKHYRVPRYVLPAIRFKGYLQATGDAGAASECEEPITYIFLNEILYLRNYEEYIHIIIPHEVAHVFVCLRGGYEEFSHGPEWKLVMRDLGFREPEAWIRHNIDTEPVYEYKQRLGKLLPPHYNPGRPTIM